jgi:BASS family bile acid:Na+ symporter
MKLLQRLSAWLVKWTALFIVLVALFTFLMPHVFDWVRGDIQTLLLGFIMLTMGLTLTPQDFKILAKRPLDIFIGACAQYTIMPLLAFALVKGLHLPAGVAVGLILVGCCPGGVSSNLMTYLCKGDVPFSVGMTTASTLLSPVMTPLLMLLLAGETIEIHALAMFKSILIVTVFPVVIGSGMNQLFHSRPSYQTFCSVMPGFSVMGLACIVGGVISQNGKIFFTSGIIIFIAVFLHNVLGYILGYLVGGATRMSLPKKRTLAIEVGMQNAGLATNLSVKHFPSVPEVAAASAVSCVWHSISGTLIAGVFVAYDVWKSRKVKK